EFLRLALPAAKFWVCKRVPMVAAEALECLGGNGYVEDCGLPRLYRDAPLNSIWEGSGNITALDVLRALARTPQAADCVLAEIDQAAGADRRLDAAAAPLRRGLAPAAAPGPAGGAPGPRRPRAGPRGGLGRGRGTGGGAPGPAAGRPADGRPAGIAADPVLAGAGGGRVLRVSAPPAPGG